MKLLTTMFGCLATLVVAGGAQAADPVKIGLILPMSGPFASTGKQVEAAARLYMQQQGDVVAGRKVELILKDDTGLAPEVTRRIAQEMVTRDGVSVLAGFGLTPLALAAAPISEQARIPMVVMAAASSVVTTKSPYILRTSGTLPQSAAVIAQWSARSGLKKVFTLVTDYAPGIDAETQFKKSFAASGGQIVGDVRVPLKNPDYGPFVQRIRDAAPDAAFVFLPSGEGAAFMKEFSERGLDKAGIKLIATGDVTDDDILPAMGDAAVGAITAHFYSAAHPSAENKAYVAAFQKANGGMRPNFMSIGGYDGMHLIYETLKKTGGKTDGDGFVAASKTLGWTSPRGPVRVDADTREIVQTIYLRKVERVDGQLHNVEFDAVPEVKDPGKSGH